MDFNFSEIQCWKCGIIFKVHSKYLKNRERYHDKFYCPNGHENYFYDETEEEKLQKEVARLEESKKTAWRWEAAAQRSITAYKGQVTKLKKQLKAQK